jgi:hypothetical protein
MSERHPLTKGSPPGTIKIPLGPPLLKGEELLWLKSHLRHVGASPMNPALAGKNSNPPSPPFRKGGMGGFETYFLGNFLKRGNKEEQCLQRSRIIMMPSSSAAA